MILRRRLCGLAQFSMLDEIDVNHKVRVAKLNASRNTIKEFTQKYLQKSEKECTLSEVRDAIISRNIRPEALQHETNDFSDSLTLNIKGDIINMKVRLFPKKRDGDKITVTVNQHDIQAYIDIKSTPESIADFILAIEGWLPEYHLIEDNIVTEEKQKRMAYDLALDLLKRTVKPILDKKNYEHSVTDLEDSSNATVNIYINETITMSLDVNLMEDFVGPITKVVDSLPEKE